MYANLKYFCVTPSLSESHVWNHRNYGGGVQLDFVTSFCREYGATPGCCWTKKEPELQNWCSPRRRRVRGGTKVFRFFRPFFRHQTPPRNSASHIEGSLQCFWKLESCTGFHLLCAVVICAWMTIALKGKRTCYVHLDRGFSSPPWHWHWKASAPSNPTCRQHYFQRFSSSEILLHSPR